MSAKGLRDSRNKMSEERSMNRWLKKAHSKKYPKELEGKCYASKERKYVGVFFAVDKIECPACGKILKIQKSNNARYVTIPIHVPKKR
jgi:hypothetical protein